MTNPVATKQPTTIDSLPDFVLGHILRIAEQNTCAQVSRLWRNVYFSSLRNEYCQNPMIQRFMPTTDRPETGIECGEILRQTINNVRDYYIKVSGVQSDVFSRKVLIEACDLEKLITESDQQADKNLVTLWNCLPPEITQQLAAQTEYPANATDSQIASAIRYGIQTNRAAIQAVLNQVTELSLAFKGLSVLPPEIGLFVNLTNLDLSLSNLLTLPAEIGNLVNLTHLDLHFNQLTSLPPQIGNLVNLTWLFLHSNQLTTLPEEIGNLVNLQSLGLEDNQITSLPPQIGNLVNLTRLILHSNQLTTLPEEIRHLRNLTRLDLCNNNLLTLPAEIGNLVNLTWLILHSNQLTTLPAEIRHLRNLTRLYLLGNNLSYAARTLIANYRIQNPACQIEIDPVEPGFFRSLLNTRDRCIGALAFGALAVFSAYVYSNLAPSMMRAIEAFPSVPL
jgi:hypothetical protein